jgi:hypothetical protein
MGRPMTQKDRFWPPAASLSWHIVLRAFDAFSDVEAI